MEFNIDFDDLSSQRDCTDGQGFPPHPLIQQCRPQSDSRVPNTGDCGFSCCINVRKREMRYIKTGLDVGETIELGQLSHVELKSSSGGVALEAISEGEEEAHVILKESGLDGGEEIDLHENAKVLGVSSGNSFVGNSLWYALPRSVYNE